MGVHFSKNLLQKKKREWEENIQGKILSFQLLTSTSVVLRRKEGTSVGSRG